MKYPHHKVQRLSVNTLRKLPLVNLILYTKGSQGMAKSYDLHWISKAACKSWERYCILLHIYLITRYSAASLALWVWHDSKQLSNRGIYCLGSILHTADAGLYNIDSHHVNIYPGLVRDGDDEAPLLGLSAFIFFLMKLSRCVCWFEVS